MYAVAIVVGLAVAVAGDYGSVFDEAGAAYRAVELRRAAALFRDAAALAGDDDVRRSQALVWSGVAAGQAGELSIARRAFDEGIALRCIDALPTAVSPKVQDVFETAVRDAGLKLPCPTELSQPTASTDQPAPPAPEAVTEQAHTPTVTATEATTNKATTNKATPTTTTSASSSSSSPLPWATVALGAGAVFGAAAAAVAIKSLVDIGVAADEATPQVDAQALLDQGNAGLVIASIAAGIGVVCVAVGATVLVLDDDDESKKPPDTAAP